MVKDCRKLKRDHDVLQIQQSGIPCKELQIRIENKKQKYTERLRKQEKRRKCQRDGFC